MNIHEYQAKTLLQKFGIPVPPFAVASNEEEILGALTALHLEEGVVKAQVHAGGRGKAGGVKFGKSRRQLQEIAENMLGMRIQNRQTGPGGVIVDTLILGPLTHIAKEYYFAIILDRERACPLLMASPEGGMEIEELAATQPEKICKIPLEGKEDFAPLFHMMQWEGKIASDAKKLIQNAIRLFQECDGLLLEINPLVLTKEGELIALDAKFSVDDNALYRQPEIAAFYDPRQYTPGEVMAKEYGLSYIGLEGEVGCLVNGAGLAMATMDTIYYYGGAPANFLDVGGGATKNQVALGFKIILSDPRVKSIFVNIFGGIMDCAILAEGIVAAAAEGVNVPLVVRMEGTNVEKGREILQKSSLSLITAKTMEEGARKAVEWRS